MGFHLTESRSRESHPTAKNRVWGFFGEEGKTRQENQSPAQQPSQGNQPSPTKTTSGVRYYGYRYYDPVTGRWPSRDPIGEMGCLNVYGMVSNRVVNWIDILGLAEVDCKACNSCKGKKDISKEIDQRIAKFNGKPDDLYKAEGVNKKRIGIPMTVIESWADNHAEATSPKNSKYKGTRLDNFLGSFLNKCVLVCGKCIGTDKLGHMLQQGYEYRILNAKHGKGAGEAYGKWAEGVGNANDPEYKKHAAAINQMGIPFGGYGLNASGVISNADLAANKKGEKLYEDIANGNFKSICDYINDDTLDEGVNKNVYGGFMKGFKD